MSLTLEGLLAAAKREPQKLNLPEIDSDVWVRIISGEVGLTMAAQFKDLEGSDTGHQARERAAISIVAFLCDEAGQAIAPTLEDARKLIAGIPMSAVTRIVQAGLRLNEMDEAASDRVEKN